MKATLFIGLEAVQQLGALAAVVEEYERYLLKRFNGFTVSQVKSVCKASSGQACREAMLKYEIYASEAIDVFEDAARYAKVIFCQECVLLHCEPAEHVSFI